MTVPAWVSLDTIDTRKVPYVSKIAKGQALFSPIYQCQAHKNPKQSEFSFKSIHFKELEIIFRFEEKS